LTVPAGQNYNMKLSELRSPILENKGKGWIGVDLDATLAIFTTWKGIEHIGEPIPAMIEKVKRGLKDGKKFKIMTARVSPKQKDHKKAEKYIKDWCKEHIGQILPVTHEKDQYMKELWDDRVRQVKKNKGTFV